MTTKYFVCIILSCLICVSAASAANWYVLPSGGSGSGTSWTAAWNGMNNINWSSVSCGDTIWVAGGTYSAALTPNKSCTSGNQLYIRRARSDATECTGAAGWSSSYDSTINHVGATVIAFNSGNTNSYITISGRTSANPGNWAGYGWYLNFTGQTGGDCINFSLGATTGITLEYMEAQGPGNIDFTSEGTAIDLLQYSGSLTGLLVSHMKIHGFSSGIYMCGVPVNPVFEYIDMYDNEAANWSSYHPDGWYTCGINGFTVRYSKLHGVNNADGFANEGIFHGGCAGTTLIYGNVFWHQTTDTSKSIEMNVSTGACTLKIFNNTFYHIYNAIWESQKDCSSSSEVRNNIFFNVAGRIDSCGTASNNLIISSPNPFVAAGDGPTADFHIIGTVGANYPRNAGTNLGSPYNYDMDGNLRGADGAWDIGAYEYVSGDTTPPTTPTNLSASAVSSSQINLTWTASTDNVGVTGYKIYRCTKSDCTPSSQLTTAPGTSYSDTGLSASTVYVYAVSAYDAAGNESAKSSSASATTQSSQTTATLGYNTIGGNTDWGNENNIHATRYTMPNQNGTVTSMSVYVASPISPSPNNQYQLAIYSDSNGSPGSLIASSQSATLTGNAWNTVSISANLSANTSYWLAYNTNAADDYSNNSKYDPSSANQSVWKGQSFGSWPSSFGNPNGSSPVMTSIYATYTVGGVNTSPAPPLGLVIQ